MVASIASLFIWGLNLGIDFKGGSLMEVAYVGARPDISEINAVLTKLSLGDSSVRPSGTDSYIIRMKTLTQAEKSSVEEALTFDGSRKTEEKRFDSIGPLLGAEAASKALVSIILVMACIVLFIAFAFRKVSNPACPNDWNRSVGRVSSWKYGLMAVVALVHDVILPIGVFSILGHYLGYEVDTLFVTALLVILGFSVHDTIVVFDRIRENLKLNRELRGKKDFETIVGDSINQTFVRSLNTSLTTLFALIVLYFLGAEATKHFSLALIIGIATGTYSSIFLASNLLVTLNKRGSTPSPISPKKY
jgi:preprotein translocase subunit SecF